MTMHFGSRRSRSVVQCIDVSRTIDTASRPTIGNFTHERRGTTLFMAVIGSGTTAMTVVRSV